MADKYITGRDNFRTAFENVTAGDYITFSNDAPDIIDLTDMTWNPIDTSSELEHGAIVFDGNTNGKIRTIQIDQPLFGWITGMIIKNLKIHADITRNYDQSQLGAIARNAQESEIINCEVTGIVTGAELTYHIGGIVGSLSSTTVVQCTCSANVTAPHGECIGGICADLNGGAIYKCINNGHIHCESINITCGGIVGYNNYAIVANCKNTGKISGIARVGGIAGKSSGGVIYGNVNAGEVIGNARTGGILGELYANGYVIYNRTCRNATIEILSAAAGRYSEMIGCVGGIVGIFEQNGWDHFYVIGNIAGSSSITADYGVRRIIGYVDKYYMASMIIDDNYAYGEMRLTGSNVGYCINAAYCGEEEYDDEVVDPDTDDDYGSGRLNGANFSCENGEQPDECMLCPTTPSDDDAGSGSCPGCCVPDLSLCMVPFTGLIGSITSMQEALARLTVAESNQLDAAATMPDIELAEAGALNDSLRGLTCCIGNVEASLVQEVKCILNVCKCHNPAPAASVNLNANALADANRVSEKNARFTLRGPRLGAPQTVVSDKNGALHLGWLHPGQYTLTPAKPTNSGARSYQVSVGDDESITIKTADGALATDLMPETAGAESDKIFKIWKQIQTRTKKRLKDEKEVKIPAIPLHERMSDHVDELSSLVNMWAKS